MNQVYKRGRLESRVSASTSMYHPAAPPLAACQADLPALRRDHGYGRLAPGFYARLAPTPLPDPYLVAYSPAAALIGLNPADFDRRSLVEALAGNLDWPGVEPLATVYGGHQFGAYVPQLGDGRAILPGGAVGPDGRVWELQLQGSGKTPYSRMGDGRAVLRSSIREFLCSEAMHALGVPTTRALAVVGSDHPVFRATVESAAVVARMAPSFVRFGSFGYFYWQQRHDDLRRLADYVLATFCAELRDAPRPYLALFEEVARRTARLIASWQAVGFCHGVMDTDNMSILGLTIDYGPFGFIDGFEAGHVCNHSDDRGRSAYHRQPQIAHWNPYCLGQAMLPQTEDIDATQAALQAFKDEFAQALDERLHAKLGLTTTESGDDALIERTIELLHANRADWTLFWRKPAELRVDTTDPAEDEPVRDLFADRAAFDAWAAGCRARLRREASVDAKRAARMNRVNLRVAATTSPRSQSAWRAATTAGAISTRSCACSRCGSDRTTSSPGSKRMRRFRRTGRARCIYRVHRDARPSRSDARMNEARRSDRHAYLGHVPFDDGRRPTRPRHCIDAAALTSEPYTTLDPPEPA